MMCVVVTTAILDDPDLLVHFMRAETTALALRDLRSV